MIEIWKPISTHPKVEDEKTLLFLPKFDLIVSGGWYRFPGEHEGPHTYYESFCDWGVDDDLIILDGPDCYPSHWAPYPVIETQEVPNEQS